MVPTSPHARAGRRRSEDRALVLRRFPYGESSLLVHLLTPEHGRFSALAKGAYRPKSGYFGVLDLFDTLHVSWSASARSELRVLAAGSVSIRRRRITTDLDRYRAGLAVLELAGLGAREGHEERRLFALVEDGLDLLHDSDADPVLVSAAFDLRFLALAGLAPALTDCASCGRRLADPGGRTPRVLFSVPLGGRLCDACGGEARGRRARLETLPLNTIRVARSLSNAPLRMLSRTRLDPARTDRVRAFVRHFLEFHLETRPRAWGSAARPASRVSAVPARSGGRPA